MTISVDELALLPEKTKRDPRIVRLYLEHTFIEAYGLHTDLRVDEDPRGAIGNPTEWDFYGDLQRDFLIERGLRPQHRLIDFGCGTGRLARKVVPYLGPSTYTGIDLSTNALAHAAQIAEVEGWAEKQPAFYRSLASVNGLVEMIWAFSVFIHVPAEVMKAEFRAIAKLMHRGSQFLFSFVPEQRDERTGLKQFRCRLETYAAAAHQASLTFDHMTWPGKQRIGIARLA